MIDETARRVEGVSRVVAYIKRLISENKQLASIDVSGEVSDRQDRNGRVYFNLKENTDLLKCVVWSDVAQKLPPFANGDAVIVSGNFSTYPAQSVYQLDVKVLEPTGIGRLYARFEGLRKKLEAEGLFEAARKRPMPRFPRRIALISARGKGAEDFETTLAKRAPHISVAFIDTLVQGLDAPVEIARAIDAASRMDVDVIVIARGGGSYEDLFAFNEEPVVRAIVRAKHPVLTAIAHTADLHLADAAADSVAETPSNGAQYFGEIRDAYEHRLETLVARLDRALRERQRARMQRYDIATTAFARIARDFVGRKRQYLLIAERRLASQTPVARLAARERRIADLRGRLRAVARGYTLRRLSRTQVLAALLESYDPQRPLQHGFAMVFRGGALVRDASTVPIGSVIEARLQRGTLTSRVEGRSDE
jgi:exodeoxyribonuclease VII large subunit